ncbi:3-hydroxyacyl-CoA dehydrogenase NAD-binding domain-containing protein [Orrella sp. 11846]|uniref:3-hydroxyacyl-CoA dehydrogenase NAD-binding domain-containing protein n=1 Tax=Orrella sp. 11846 TaxID=3409913 RepID=UPI003B5A1794
MVETTWKTFAQGKVAVLRLDNPPVNSLGSKARVDLSAAFQAAAQDFDVKAIVLTGTRRFFSAGADIREFNTPTSRQEPFLRDLINQIEECSKPTVAAINGIALGGGLELALGCEHRVASADAQLGLPEVKLGLLPGAGGTQRLPRFIGVQNALEIIVRGDPVSAQKAQSLGLVSEVLVGDLIAKACEFAITLVDQPRRDLATWRSPLQASVEAKVFDHARQQGQKYFRGCVAPQACVDCIEQTLTRSLADGFKYESERFQELVQGTQSKAQRHLFFAQRKAAKAPETDQLLPEIKQVVVIGAGTMGVGIAMSVASAGIQVRLFERDEGALEKGLAKIRQLYEGNVKSQRITETQMHERLARIEPILSYDDMAQADLVIEAAFEDMAVKKAIFTQLKTSTKPGAVLATNTSRLDINDLATVVDQPEFVLGTHFFSPANVMRLLEVVKGDQTSPAVIAAVFKFAQRIGKIPVLVGVCDGFVGNRMVSPYTREAQFLLEEGATPSQVDGALRAFGLAMGPIEMGDMAGLDISWAARKRLAPTRPAHIRYSKVADTICELGRFGQKTGSGFYRYEPGQRTPIADPFIDELIERCAQEAGIERREISDEEIIERTIYALVNEGARLLKEGIAQRASDIDVIYVTGYGFPVGHGGPMFYADTVGLPKVLARIREFHAQHGELWEPAPLLIELVNNGQTFADFEVSRV